MQLCLCSKLVEKEQISEEELDRHCKLLQKYLADNKPSLNSVQITIKEKSSPSGNQANRSSAKAQIEKLKKFILPVSVIDFLDQNYTTYWQDPSTFWAPSAPNAHILGNPLTFIVVELKRLDAAGMLATLQRPLRCLALHRLWKQFRSIGKAELPLVAKSILEAGLFPEISEKQLLDDCSSFTEAGSRYHRIAEKLGIGSLGLLGNEIPKSVWERNLRVKGEQFEHGVEALRNRGLEEKAKQYNALFQRLFDFQISQISDLTNTWLKQYSTQSPKTVPSKRRRTGASSSMCTHRAAEVPSLRDALDRSEIHKEGASVEMGRHPLATSAGKNVSMPDSEGGQPQLIEWRAASTADPRDLSPSQKRSCLQTPENSEQRLISSSFELNRSFLVSRTDGVTLCSRDSPHLAHPRSMDGNALTGNPSTRNPSSIGPEIGAAETPSQSPTIQASRTRVSPFTGDHTLGEPADWLIYVLLAESEPRPERRTSETGQNLEQAQYPSGPIGMQLATAPLENNEGYNMGQIAHGFQHHDQYLMGPAVTQFNQTNYDMAQVVLDCQSYDQYSTEFPAYNTGQILLYSQE